MRFTVGFHNKIFVKFVLIFFFLFVFPVLVVKFGPGF